MRIKGSYTNGSPDEYYNSIPTVIFLLFEKFCKLEKYTKGVEKLCG